MRIVILKDENLRTESMDEVDNQNEADFAEKCLSLKHSVKQIPFTGDIRAMMATRRKLKPDVVFNLVESVCESGALSVIAVQVLEIMGIPFTGNHIYSQIISANKSIAKRVLMEKDIPAPIGCFKPDTEYILKAKTEHASMALDDSCITKFSSELELKATIADKEKETGMEWIAEKYIDGREFNCAFIGDQILPPAEIRFDRDFVGHKVLTYQAKWGEESDSYQQSLRHFDIEDSVLDRLC